MVVHTDLIFLSHLALWRAQFSLICFPSLAAYATPLCCFWTCFPDTLSSISSLAPWVFPVFCPSPYFSFFPHFLSTLLDLPHQALITKKLELKKNRSFFFLSDQHLRFILSYLKYLSIAHCELMHYLLGGQPGTKRGICLP